MKLFVFDLDFTLWNAGDTWCDCTTPPYKWKNGQLQDSRGRWIRLYDDVPEILHYLRQQQYLMAVASRTSSPRWALELLHKFEINDFFAAQEIYPGDKFAHLRNIMRICKVPPDEVVFFDDEYRNIRDIQTMGIESVLIENGLNPKHIEPYL